VPFALFRDRNFTIMSAVGAAVSAGMIGFYIPITIFLQSVLDFSALKAGLVLAPASLVSMVVAPFAGRMSDRIGGASILICGLIMYAVGAVWVAVISAPAMSWVPLFAPFVVMGVGMGCMFAPMATEAMRAVPLPLAGAASGVNNTVRQIGSVVGSAAVGALLQSRLAGALGSEAARRSGELPAAARAPFVAGFRDAARGGLQVGAGQSGAAPQLPRGLPEAVVEQVQKLGAQVFDHGYLTAMRTTMILPVTVALLGVLLCLAARRHRSTSIEPIGDRPANEPEAGARLSS